jgi:hypothetical protein
MERREREERAREALRNRLSGMALPRKRSPRQEVIEILAEGMWTLICQGRGPAAGEFQPRRDETQDPVDQERWPPSADGSND